MSAVLVQRRGEARPVELLQPRVEGGAAAGELSTEDGVLKQDRRQQSSPDREELRAHILDLPFHLHPPVLEPRFHLREDKEAIN